MTLSDGNENISKGVFAVIAISLWAIKAVSSTIQKQRKDRLAREKFAGIPLPAAPPTPNLIPVPPVRVPRRQPVIARPKQRAAAILKRLTPPPVPLPLPAAILSRGTQAGRSGGMSPPPPRVANATAASIHKWLRPETLQSQFILCELLQPPVALRRPGERTV